MGGIFRRLCLFAVASCGFVGLLLPLDLVRAESTSTTEFQSEWLGIRFDGHTPNFNLTFRIDGTDTPYWLEWTYNSFLEVTFFRVPIHPFLFIAISNQLKNHIKTQIPFLIGGETAQQGQLLHGHASRSSTPLFHKIEQNTTMQVNDTTMPLGRRRYWGDSDDSEGEDKTSERFPVSIIPNGVKGRNYLYLQNHSFVFAEEKKVLKQGGFKFELAISHWYFSTPLSLPPPFPPTCWVSVSVVTSSFFDSPLRCPSDLSPSLLEFSCISDYISFCINISFYFSYYVSQTNVVTSITYRAYPLGHSKITETNSR